MTELQQRHRVQVGSLIMGGGEPVVIQSMTNTPTKDVEATVDQAYALYQAGASLIRLTINDEEAAEALPSIYEGLKKKGWLEPLLVGDFHYNGHILLNRYDEMARLLVKYRINPGNVGFGDKKDLQFEQCIQVAKQYNKVIRIGVNWGSVEPGLVERMMDDNARLPIPESSDIVYEEALITSVLKSAEHAVRLGIPENRIVISCKVSEVSTLVSIYQKLAKRTRWALHLGLTEAGMGMKGMVATTAALSQLLSQGIGDTIRASLTPEPEGDRTLEVKLCQEILQSLGIQQFVPSVSACPGCGRTSSSVYQHLARSVQIAIEENMPLWKLKYPGVESLKIAVMGCIVNGPGESKHADIGISLPGSGELPAAPVFIEGKKQMTLRGKDIDHQFIQVLKKYIHDRFSKKETVK